MKILKGIPVSPGVAIGRVVVLDDEHGWRVPRRTVSSARAEEEVSRFDRAREASIRELEEVHRRATDEMGDDAARIFRFHIGALSDQALIGPVMRMIRDERVTAEFAAATVFRRWADLFSKESEAGLQAKVSDLQDLANRVLGLLMGERRGVLADLDEPTVVAARDLTPSQTAGFDRSKILGFATDLGGQTSHTAIVARALSLPAVVGCQRMTSLASDGAMVIIDGDRGTVILEPDEETIDQYEAQIARQETFRVSLRELVDMPAVTRDGVEIELLGNIEFPEEAQAVLELGGTGVGLYRTEFLYLANVVQPTEEDHYRAYTQCLDVLGDRPLTIRTVDLGADKYTQERTAVPERNPFLGLRSIRYCLQNLSMFKTQLRAIVRASAHGKIKVMFPLITSPHEFRAARHLMYDAMEDLQEQGIEFDRKIPVGMMVEVPSAAIMAQTFARDVDFFSIGTNDLVQYTLAVDRTNERVADYYQPAHPAVSKLIRDVVRASRREEIPVSCCGEAAGDLGMAMLLLGLGVRTLSVTASGIPPLKRMVRSVTIAQCERIARKVISLDSELEAAAFLRNRARKLAPEAFDGRSDEL